MWSILLVFFATLLLLLLLKTQQLVWYWRKKGVPHESYWSYLYKNFVRFRHEDINKVLEEYQARYGMVYGTYQGLRPVLTIGSLEGAKDLFVRNFSSAYNRSVTGETGNPLWDKNIIVLDYPLWKSVRHLSSPAFSAAKLKLMLPKFQTVADQLTGKFDKLATTSTNSPVCLYKYIYGAALDRIAAIAYGIKLDAMENPDNPFVKNSRGVFAPSLGLTLLTIMPSLIKYTPIHYPPKHITDFFMEFTATLIKQRRQQGPRENDVDILDMWLAEQKTNPNFTDELIASQAFVFFVAGFDTSANTLYYTLYLLAMHPEVQELAYREITELAPDPNNISYEQYARMKTLEACAIETLRMYPVDYVTDRIIAKPCTIAGIPLDPGVIVQTPLYAFQRNPAVFPNPNSYSPQRFLSEVTPDASKQLDAFLSFGSGPRNCLGRRLALFSITVELCTILRRIRLRPAVTVEDPASIELGPGQHFLAMPKDEFLVRLEPRT